ncbi:MAG: hypothetical protein HFE81_06535 [Bacilli bacterium]|nr:hypothetical protein [Bacilli bacterium]
MNSEYNLDEIIAGINFEDNKFNNVNGLMLTNREITVLEQYKINYKSCSSLKEILFEIEDILNDMDIVDEELDYISSTISERDYYQNTNK